MMFLVGLAYVVFGTILSDGIPAGHDLRSAVVSNAGRDPGARTVLGVQTGLIGLAMYVTSSSVRSLQAKQGLPLGNQVVGWLVLGAQPRLPMIVCPHR